MIRVIIESPYAGDVEANLTYLRACMRECLLRGEAPFASHALYTQPGVLDDLAPSERALGIGAGFVWRASAAYTLVYIDRGVSHGMVAGVIAALSEQEHPVYACRLGEPEQRERIRSFEDLDKYR